MTQIIHKNLKANAISGIRWTGVATVSITLLQLAQLAILGRFLEPKDFGLMAIIMVVIEVGRIFSEMGLSTAIIQRDEIRQTELSTLYWLNIAAGISVFILIVIFTPFFAKSFKTPEINNLLPVAALIFVISPFGAQYYCLLQKALRFNILTRLDVSINVVIFVITTSCAIGGLGIWSLIFGQLTGIIVRTVFLAVYGWSRLNRPIYRFKWFDTKGYLSFGLYRVGAMAINHLNSRIDQIVIGLLLGPVQLGYYNVAFNLALQPVQKINPIVTKVAFPVFSIVQNDVPRLRRGYFKMIKLLATVNSPILIGLAVAAPVFVPFLMGEQWTNSVPIVQILVFYSLIRSFGNAAGSLICASGHADWTLYWNIVLLLFIPATVYIAGQGGKAVDIAIALVVLQCILFIAHYRIFLRNILGVCFNEYIRTIGIPLILALLMGGAIYIGTLPGLILWPEGILIQQVIIGILFYINLLWFFQRNILVEIINFIPSRFNFFNCLKRSR